MTNVDDVKSFQLEIMEMENKLRNVADQLTSRRHDLDELLIMYEIAVQPDVGVVPVNFNGVVLDIDAVIICDSMMEKMFAIHAKVNKRIISLKEALDDKN